jgi:WD40 repeat protein
VKTVDPPSTTTSFSSTLNQNCTFPTSTVETSSAVTPQVSRETQIFQTEWETEPELQKVIDNQLPINFSSRHPLIVSGDHTGEVKFWNSQNGDLIGIMHFSAQISQLEFSVDGAHLAICSGAHVLVYNVSTGKLIQRIPEWVPEPFEKNKQSTYLERAHRIIESLLFELKASEEKIRELLEAREEKIPEPLSNDQYPLEKRISQTKEEFCQRLLEKNRERLLRSYSNKLRENSSHQMMSRTAIFLPGDQYLALGDKNETVTLWNYREASLVAVLSDSCDTNSGSSVSSSGSANSNTTTHTFSKNYGAESGTTRKTTPIVFNSDTSELISVSDDQTVLFWNPETCLTTRKFKTEESISHLTVSYDGTYLATFHHGANLQATPNFQVWKIKDWDSNNQPAPELCELPIMLDEPKKLSPIVFSRCNNLASCASTLETFVWEVGNPNTKVITLDISIDSLIQQMKQAFNFGANFIFRPTVFSPDGGFLATGDFDGRLRLWNLKDNICEQSWQAHSNTITAIAFSPVNT